MSSPHYGLTSSPLSLLSNHCIHDKYTSTLLHNFVFECLNHGFFFKKKKHTFRRKLVGNDTILKSFGRNNIIFKVSMF